MFYLAGQILVFVLVAMLLGAGLAWFFLIGPVRRQPAARAAGGDAVPDGTEHADDDATGAAAPGVIAADLAARLQRQQGEWARERAELTGRLAAAEQQAAESEQRVAVAERQVSDAERRVAEIEYQLRDVEEGGLAGVGDSGEVPVSAGGAGGAGGAGEAGRADQARSAVELARETTRLREALADAESRTAKISSRLAITRTEAEDAQRQVAAMSLRLDRHQAEWAAEKVQLTALIPDGGAGGGQEAPALAGGAPAPGGGSRPGSGTDEGRPAPAQEGQAYGMPAIAALSRDNLKEIVGIGQAVEARLHNLGITSFRQLAVMGDADVDRLARKLDGLGDRIVPDDWVGQARDLQARYHGGLA